MIIYTEDVNRIYKTVINPVLEIYDKALIIGVPAKKYLIRKAHEDKLLTEKEKRDALQLLDVEE